jgi:hypothetical protein
MLRVTVSLEIEFGRAREATGTGHVDDGRTGDGSPGVFIDHDGSLLESSGAAI